MSRKRTSARRVGLAAVRPRGREWVWALSAAGLVLNGLRLRGRVAALTLLDRSAPGGRARGGGGRDRLALIAVNGAHVDADALATAVDHAEVQRLDLLELVPADLDPDRTLDLVRQVDPDTYRGDRLAAGRGAAQAVLVDRTLLTRLDAQDADRPVTEADVAELIAQAKLFAPVGCDLAVVDGVHAAPETPDRRRALLHAEHGGGAGIAVGAPLVGLGVLAAGAVLAPGWAVLAAAAYCAQPWIALRGGPLADGLSPRALVARPAASLVRALRVAGSAARPHGTLIAGREVSEEVTRKREEAARARYTEALAGGTDRFFDPRRDDCPWCGAGDLVRHLECTDDLQHKPGTFRLDRCGSCGHVFQNPALSLAGLDFYYGDFYDGVGEDELEAVFASSARPYEGRARLVRRHVGDTEPAAWLDVGTGHGHFCLMARAEFPDTTFEGLDLGDAVVTAARRGWIDRGHQGLLPDVAADMAGRFDVVSMHHYLEHTRDPGAELAAARTALRPGGHLLIEVPDPECRAGALLGRWWGPWFQPQHQHLMPLDNLCDRLEAEGYTVVATEREEAHQPIAAAMAVWLLLNHFGPKVGQPWQPPATAAGTARRVAVFAAGAPAIALALAVDKLAGPTVARLPGGPNAYRILARVDDTSPSAPAAHRAADRAADATAGADTAGAARHARRRRRAQAYAAEGLDPAPHPEPRTWQAALLAQLAAARGAAGDTGDGGLAYARAPEALDHAHGPWAFGIELTSSGRRDQAAGDGDGGSPAADPVWPGPLTVRLGDVRAEVEREAAALAACATHGLGAPAVVADVRLDRDDREAGPEAGGGAGGDATRPLWALVTTRPTDMALPDLIGRYLQQSDDLLVGFANHHADLHDRTAGAPPAGIPVIDPTAEVERIDVTRYAPTVAWLRAHAPEPADPERAVLCHGGYQPLCVYGPGPDTWGDHGGPGGGLTATNWCGAVVAEREYDVAFTLVAFWSAPFFAPSRAERTAVKMIRNTLATTYRQAYGRRVALDPERLAFWQAFHAQRGVARLDGAFDATGSPYAVTDRGPLPAPLRDQLVRYVDLVVRA